MSANIHSQIEAELTGLPPESQQQVLDFLRALKRAGRSSNSTDFSAFAGAICSDDLRLIQTTIEDGCEQVDLNEW